MKDWSIYGTGVILLKVFYAKVRHFLGGRLLGFGDTTIKSICNKWKISYEYLDDVNHQKIEDLCCNIPNLILFSFQHQYIKPKLIDAVSGSCFNLHPQSFKISWVKPIHWAIYNGEPSFSVSLHRVSQYFDTGEIYIQKRFGLGRNSLFLIIIRLVTTLPQVLSRTI